MKTRLSLLLSLFLLVVTTALSQEVEVAYNSTDNAPPRETPRLPNMNMMAPSFVGGDQALADYMRSNVVYPERAKKQGIEGTVILEYYITKEGTIEDISVVKSVTLELDREAYRLVKNMPLWNPAIQNSRPRRVKYKLPVKFELDF